MNSRYNYDERAETWPVFVLAVLSVAVVPVSVGALHSALTGSSSSQTSNTTNKSISGAIALPAAAVPEEVKQYRARARRGKLFTKKVLFLLFGWISIAALTFHISSHEVQSVVPVFDPYEILDIGFGSTEKEVKSHFRKLSVKYHPDKIKSDATEEEKKETEDKYVLISKAYKALTDEVTKANYEKYGHPDGPQETTHGIALPRFLVEGKLSSPVLLVLYILIIGFVLPSIVSNWWANTKAYTKKGIHNDTANVFLEKLLNYNPSKIVTVDDIVQWLSETYELNQFGYTQEEIISVLNSYLERKDLAQKELSLIAKVPSLLTGLIDIAATFRNTDVTFAAVQAHKQFVQALQEENKNDLLQLPNVDPSAIAKAKITKLGKLLTLSKDEIKTTLGIKSDAKLEETLSVATKIPSLKLIKAEFKVPGEVVVTPASNSYLSVKFLVRSAKHHGVSKVSLDKLKEVDTMETLRNPYKIVSDQPLLPISYSSYLPVLRRSNYIAFVVLQKDGRIAEAPAVFQNLDLSNLELTQEEYTDGEKVKIGTFKIPISSPTPSEVGKYQFRVVIKSLDYFTNDIDTTVIMNVEQPPRLEELDEGLYDIPDPDEDSLAGALASMKGEKVRKVEQYESSDDEDEDEEEEEEEDDDFTDINTDTEDEGDN